jgi:MFS family permease
LDLPRLFYQSRPVAASIASLLVVGALSDHVGRRPMLAAAITPEAAALVLFITAGDVTLLFLARLVQGVASGAAMTTLGATLVDLNPPHSPGRAGVVNSTAPTSGLALGALSASAPPGIARRSAPHPALAPATVRPLDRYSFPAITVHRADGG